ncbi:hypothetical protein CHLRE_03g191950v5 [Chlamydomonas reinhardtii]|uniref:RimM N-terminal domain-containing protein n=1 Tax=Chlamydomonas reinhardtii TaxID=3055 RepID=A0A2K3DYE1_CHLRE|nr:uncharacterized protein CHLRE_03g191950v5 [Chlamydomonas reinhardtii]PNW85551.1 hypothetical protein CHLRE_03g191950v5 [Chlamydomonas reinhardtii]
MGVSRLAQLVPSSSAASQPRPCGCAVPVPARAPACALLPTARAWTTERSVDSQPSTSSRNVIAAAGRRQGPSSPSGPATPSAGGSAGPAAPSHGLVGVLPFDEASYVEVGRVTGAHGVRGELRVEPSTDQPAKRFKAGSKLYLLPPAAQGLAARAIPQALTLAPVTSRGAKVRPLGKGEEAWLVALDEVGSRTQAEQLRGHLLYVAASDREALRDPDEFYVTDIIGCSVLDQASGRLVGQVVDVFSGMGTHDTLRVKLRASEADIMNSRIRYCMIPFAKAICPVLDLKSRTLEVAPPEGLLDMASAVPLKKPLSDEAKAQKLQELREQLQKEEEARQQRKQQQPQASEASAAAKDDSDSDSDDDAADEGEGEGEQEAEVEQAAAPPRRRPGLRRGAGGLRLGRKRV